MSDVAFVLGSEPGPASLLPAVLAGLHQTGATTTVQLAHELRDVDVVSGADVVVLRALSIDALDRLRPLEATGVRCCNRIGATAAARDKAESARLLAEAGVPAPATVVFDNWASVQDLASSRPVVAKPVHGSRGHGVVFLDRGQRCRAPWPGPYLVQDRIDHDGRDRKVYVVGTRVAGVVRRWPPVTLSDKHGAAFAPDREERDAALAAGAALGLEIYGVDLLAGAEGPMVVDVNAFPGFKGVPAAATWVTEHLAALAHAVEVARCAS
ncbi:hypothetical protein BH18ACT4_BH18ACT4_05270 [soil metagenome]